MSTAAQFPAETSADGAFVRQRHRFRDRITADGSSGNPTGIVPKGPLVDWSAPHDRGGPRLVG